METEYIEVRKKQWNNWLANSPIQITEWRLMAGTTSADYYIQFILRNTGNDDITNIKLAIALCDKNGEKFKLVPFEYKKIKMVKRRDFGEEYYINVGERIPEKIKLSINEVRYENGRVWSNYKSVRREILPKQTEIESLSEIQKNMIKRSFKVEHIMYIPERVMYIPVAEHNFWMCSCGQPNEATEETCIRCSLDKQWLFKNVKV